MPYSDRKKQRESQRQWRANRARSREPDREPSISAPREPEAREPGKREPSARTLANRSAAVAAYWGPLAAYMARPGGRERIVAISDSLAAGRLGHMGRYGIEGPTFAEIASVLK